MDNISCREVGILCQEEFTQYLCSSQFIGTGNSMAVPAKGSMGICQQLLDERGVQRRYVAYNALGLAHVRRQYQMLVLCLHHQGVLPRATQYLHTA